MYEESKKAGVQNLNPLLRQKLNGTERRYPEVPEHGDPKCDVVFQIKNRAIWLESKLIQPHNGGNEDRFIFSERNRNFQKYMGFEGRQPHPHAAIYEVLDRLPSLDDCPDADYVGFLMVIYDSPRYCVDNYLVEFERQGNLSDWESEVLLNYLDPRPRARLENARILVRYWERPTTRRLMLDRASEKASATEG